MSRACSPGGRFTTDFETNAINSAITMDLRNPVGTMAQWYIYDVINSVVDPIYDVSGIPDNGINGKIWYGPYEVPIVRAIITQGQTKTSQQGFYNADLLHLTVNSTDMNNLIPNIMENPDDLGRHRIVWKDEVWRPYQAQQKGVVAENFTLLSIDCIQVMPEEMVNDPQFLDKATPPPGQTIPSIISMLDGGSPSTTEFTSLLDGDDVYLP